MIEDVLPLVTLAHLAILVLHLLDVVDLDPGAETIILLPLGGIPQGLSHPGMTGTRERGRTRAHHQPVMAQGVAVEVHQEAEAPAEA